jgi:hypothetical protein
MKKVMPSASNLFDRWDGKRLSKLLALFVAIALTPSMLLAQEWDHLNGRDKVHDPTGAWIATVGNESFLLITFEKGGTVLQDFQGESAFDPAAVNPPITPRNVQTSPQHGVWQKTSWKTFAATLVAIEAGNDTSILAATFFRFDKFQYTGTLNESGDQMDLTLVASFFDADGKRIGQQDPIKLKAARVQLEILPNSADRLPVPK